MAAAAGVRRGLGAAIGGALNLFERRSGAALRRLGDGRPGWAPRAAFATRTVPVPSMGDSITEGVVNTWKKKVGDYVERDEVVLVLDSDKVSVDVNAPVAGVVTNCLAKVDDVVAIGQPLFEIDDEGKQPAGAAAKPAEPAPPKTAAAAAVAAAETPPPSASPQATPVTPAPRPSSASAGAAAAAPAAAKKPPPPAAAAAAAPGPRTITRSPMSSIRKRIAERLKTSQNTAASLTTFNECDMSGLMALRAELNEEFVRRHGCKMGFVSPFLYAASRALLAMPALNAYVDGSEIVSHSFVDISVAVATPNGLLVPVVRDCERKTIAELEAELQQLAAKGREGKIALEDMQGGTHTISNGGVFGSLMGTPILNPPQSSILGLHATKPRAVVVDGEVAVRPMMYLALTYDHRIVDGAEAVQFLVRIKNQIEDPRRMLLGL